MRAAKISARLPRRGSSLVEFALVALQLSLVMFAGLEFGRMVLVYTNLCNAARVGVRYAIVHGSERTGTGVNGPASSNDICGVAGVGGATTNGVVADYAKAGLLNPKALSCTVSWPDGGLKTAGSRVQVTVTYPYDPFVVLPLRVTLGTTTEGIITF